MSDYWQPNPDWRRLDSPAEGDIIQLKHVGGFSHLVKLIVRTVTDLTITGVVEAVYDWDSREPITGGEVLSLVGKEITPEKGFMHNVIKKSAHLK